MSEWLHGLPLTWMALVVFGATYLAAAAIYAVVSAFAAIAMVHSDNRLAAGLAMGLFATGVAASVMLIAAHDRPFVGELAIGPEPLLQVMPAAGS
jgi:hypothetical protein